MQKSHQTQSELKKFGTISLSESLQPGIKLAEEGYPVSELISWAWAENESKLKFRESGSELLNKNNKAPVEGEVIRLPELASSMYKISKEENFYKQEYWGCIYSLRDTNNWRKKTNRKPINFGKEFYNN